MSKRKILVIVCSFLLFLLLVPTVQWLSSQAASAQETSSQSVERSGRAEAIVENMSTEQQIYQTFFMYFRQWNGKGFTQMNEEVRSILNKYNFGGVVYFEQNCDTTAQTLQLTKDIQAESTKTPGTIPLLFTIDQEGGRVVRLNSGTSMPGNMALGATQDVQSSFANGDVIGSELHSLAINTDYSPVVDVNNNANNPVIGLRSFGDDPQKVAENGVAYLNGLDKNNVIACAKHFPGHGDTVTDSHTGVPCINKTLNELKNCELIPFQALIDNGVDMIMSAHIQYPQIDASTIIAKDGSSYYPTATISHKMLTEILKGDMGFDGVISTDGMHMTGITMFYDEPEACYQALKAGVDMMCGPVSGTNLASWTKSFNEITSYLKQKCQEEPEFAARVKDAATRVVRLKEKRGVLDYKASDYPAETAESTVGGTENRNAEREISAKAVTVTKNENGALPLHVSQNSKVLLLCQNNGNSDMAPQLAIGWNRAKEADLIPAGAQLSCVHFDKDHFTVDGDIKTAIDNADTVIVNSMLSATSQMAPGNYQTAGVQNAIDYCAANGKKSIVISNYNAYDVQLYQNASAILAVFGPKGCSETYEDVINNNITMPKQTFGPNTIAGMEVILGVFGASGRLPIDIPRYDQVSGKYIPTDIVYSRGFGLTYDPITQMEKVNVEVEDTEHIYNGQPQCPKIVCTIADRNKTLVESKDFKVTYHNNVNIGTATATVTGMGSYVGEKSVNFEIVAAPTPGPDPDQSSGQDTNIDTNNDSNPAQTGDTIYLLVALFVVLTGLSVYYLLLHQNIKRKI